MPIRQDMKIAAQVTDKLACAAEVVPENQPCRCTGGNELGDCGTDDRQREADP